MVGWGYMFCGEVGGKLREVALSFTWVMGLISAQQACTVRAFLCWCSLCDREDEAMTHLQHGLLMTREAYEETDMAEPSPMRVALLDGRSLPVP